MPKLTRQPDMRHVATLREGDRVAAFGGGIVIANPEHAPRFIHADEDYAKALPYERTGDAS